MPLKHPCFIKCPAVQADWFIAVTQLRQKNKRAVLI